VDLVGIEPTTSSMPFPSTNCVRQRESERERHLRLNHCGGRAMLPAFVLYPSDTVRYPQTPVGVVRLRHNS